VRVYDRLFTHEDPSGQKEIDFKSFLNPESLTTVEAYLEPSLGNAQTGDRYQFQRLGYFVVDKSSVPDHLIFNKTVGLRDTFTKKQN